MEIRDAEVGVPEVSRQKLQELLEDPRLKPRLQLMLVLGMAFLVSAVVIGGIGLAGVIPVQADLSEGGLWWVMVGMAIAELVAIYVILGQLLSVMARTSGFDAAAGKGLTALVVGLALAESIAIYSFIGALMAMPPAAQVGLVVLSVVTLLAVLSVVRGRVGHELARRLHAEAEQRRRR